MTNEEFLDTLEKCRKELLKVKVSDEYIQPFPYWIYKKVPKKEWINYFKTHPGVTIIFIKDFTKNIRYKLTEKGELERLYI